MTKAFEERVPPAGSVTPVEGWSVQSPLGLLRCDDTPGGQLVRLADVVRWLTKAKELPFAQAVKQVAAMLTQHAGDFALYLVDEHDYATHCGQENPFDQFVFSDEEMKLPRLEANTRKAAASLANVWLMPAHELARLANEPGIPAFYDSDKETPFEYFERSGAHVSRYAVTFSSAHQFWGWGTAATQVTDAEPASAFPLADFAALVALRVPYVKAGNRLAWALGNQLEILRDELNQRVAIGQTESSALDAMGWELGYTGAEPRKPLKKALELDRKRKRAGGSADVVSSLPLVTRVRDGKKVA